MPYDGRIDRRTFLKQFGRGAAAFGILSCLPGFVRAEDGFTLALKGQDLIQKKAYDRAVAVLREAVAIDPASDWAFGLLGRAYHGNGQNAQAVAAFREAIRLNSRDTYSRMMVDILTQEPLPRLPKTREPMGDLERAAKEEDLRMTVRSGNTAERGYHTRRVVIDPGHGGFDSGAVGQTGLKEKDITLDIARALHDRLKTDGRIRSFLTRTGDYYVPLSARTAIANQYQADLFISIHINASERRSPSGSETYYGSEEASSAEAARVAAFENSVIRFDETYKRQPGYIDIEEMLTAFEQRLYWNQSEAFAGIFQRRMAERLPLKSRGIQSANFYVLRRAKMPAILLESGFISNRYDEAKLRHSEFRHEIAEAIARGLS
jgi:N-acetylmuramoyl-L-alanine amidase